mmetsp:Transcript_24033/g.43238  ORF Transcript_24033/g.43238 Transcript_24033/m.43238 type:complete len:341 (+) Transcript_24033:70-1092(+)
MDISHSSRYTFASSKLHLYHRIAHSEKNERSGGRGNFHTPTGHVVHDPDASSSDASRATSTFGRVARKMHAFLRLVRPPLARRGLPANRESSSPPRRTGRRGRRGDPSSLASRRTRPPNSASAIRTRPTLRNSRGSRISSPSRKSGGRDVRRASRRGWAPAVAAADPSDEIPNERIRTRTRERCAIRGERADDCIHGTADGTKRDESSRLDAPSRRAVRRSRSSSTFRDARTGGMRRGRAYPSSHRGGEERGNRVEGTGEAEEGSVGRIPAGVRGLHWSLMAMFALFIGVFTLVMPWLGGDDIVYPPTPPPPARVVKENEVLTGESIEKDDSDDSNKKDR